MRVKSGQKLHDCKEFSLAEASLSLDYATSERLVNRTLQWSSFALSFRKKVCSEDRDSIACILSCV